LREDIKTPSGNDKFQMTNSKFSLLLFIALGLILAWGASALSKDDIVFPVAELGSCQNEQECRAYCDDTANITQCIAFAEKYNLLSQSEIEKAKKFQSIGAVGPGGCTSENECETYCEDTGNIEECLAFAEENGFMDAKELEEAKQVAKALREGAQLPGGCTSKGACEEYCSDSANMKECVEFAEKAGFMSPEELREAKQVLKALDAGVPFPGNCKGKNECDAYCQDPNNMEECVNFGIAAGFIPPEEVEQVRKMIPLMRSGIMPGECKKGKEQCEAYCGQEENIEECTVFFTEAGFMTQEEAQMFRKTGGKGPGDCKGKEECEAFCNNPANQETCFAFAKEHGLISEEDLKNIEEGTRQMKDGLEMAPPEVAECLKQKVGTEVLQKIEAGTFVPNPQLGDSMKSCFEEFMPRPQEGFEQGQFNPGENEGFEDRVPTLQNLEQIIREQQGQKMEEQMRQQFIPQTQQQDSRAAACAEEGGVWDGSACRPAGASGEFFPETGPSQDQQVIQQTQEQIQRQLQQQQLEQQIQEQQQQLQQQLQLLEQQTTPTQPPTPTGGSILDAAGSLLKRFFQR
jgi:hypothetical protein